MWTWRSKEDDAKLVANINKTVRSITLFLMLGSLTLNLLCWLAVSVIKLEGRSLKELLDVNPLLAIAVGMIITTLYTMWVVKSYREAMSRFRGNPTEEICEEEKKKAAGKIGLCGTFCMLGWFINAVGNLF